jgi:Tfp pilus assembly protein FimT
MELMVVLVLIGILTAVILPEMRGTFQDALLRSSSRQLLDVLSLASSEAVSRNQAHRVVLEPSTGRYQLERRKFSKGEEMFVPSDLPGAAGKLDSRISVQVRSGELNQNGSQRNPQLSESAPELVFYPDGTCAAAAIILRDPTGISMLLRLNPTTARATVVRLDAGQLEAQR